MTIASESPKPLSETLFAGGGEMGALMRSHDWANSKLGSVETWPQSLRTGIRIILGSRIPMFIWWGRARRYQNPSMSIARCGNGSGSSN
ncbi:MULTISPECIES: hypothetical protein [Nostocales]|uniref:Uncharacterized protein n=3 Tax=Nostocales TaxID=1161 RepID=A0A0C1NLK6_9CYAN|nr:hypothetical protein [Tolypothrix bouteillei]